MALDDDPKKKATSTTRKRPAAGAKKTTTGKAPAKSSAAEPAQQFELGTAPWRIKGELILNCNCTVFCPCVVSLGQHPPTEGYCQTWGGIRIDEGHYAYESLAGLNIGLLIEIPGLMARGNWKAAAFIDDRASDAAYEGLVNIMTGAAKGTTGLFQVLVSEFLGAERAPITYENEGSTRRVTVGRKIKGEVVPVPGKDGNDVVITNTQYWMGPDVTVATANLGRVRAFGRVWDFNGRSAEICQIDWSGPS